MNPFREMVLLSVDHYKQLQQSAVMQKAPKLQRDLNQIEQQYGDTLPIDQKLKLTTQAISKYAHKTNDDDLIPLPPPPPVLDDTLLKTHFDSFNPVNKKRALQMYQHLKSIDPQWNSMGQLLNDYEEPIKNSNIVELIDLVTNTKRTTRIPAGFSRFVQLLQSSNIPRNFLSTSGLAKVDKQLENADKEDLDNENLKWTKVA